MKKIFLAAITACLALSSCEDMLSPESDMVMYEEDNTLSSVNDTLYSVMGVVHLMQQVADRTNLLGEVRADLVQVTPAATTDLQALANSLTSTDNAYNRPEDFYAIVNNCNYFIQTADTGYTKYNQKVFEREMAVMHTYRAWAYLQLVTTYGEIPFYTHFLGTQASAEEVMRQPRQGIKAVCDWLIDDLQPFISTYELEYGVMNTISSRYFFIPVRVILGELCLWAGRYQEAAQYYHDFIADLDHPRPISRSEAYWFNNENPTTSYVNGYTSIFSRIDNETITIIPMENNVFDGTISHLEDLYCSTSDNDYFYELTWSEALVQLSADQAYYYEYEDPNTHARDTVCMTTDSVKSIYPDRKRHGDLRLFTLVNQSSVGTGTKYNDTYQTIRKHSNENGFVTLYRLATIYLHYAEALNRAGFPAAAFAILKYGLCDDNTKRPEGDVIPAYERSNAGTLFAFRNSVFTKNNTWGIHSRGCGDSFANPEYMLPMPANALASAADTIAFQQPLVEDYIVNELALETCFEGQRFYDLMRVALRRNDPAYLANPIAQRIDPQHPDEELRARLMDQKNWYLPLK